MSAGLPVEVVDAIRPLPTGYVVLLKRLVDVVNGDCRVRATWLGGSAGRRAADAGSDLDVLLAVSDESFEGFCADWRSWLAEVTATIIAREIPGMVGCFYSVTTDCQRLDVVVESVHDLGSSAYRHRLVVLDKDGLDGRLPAEADLTPDVVGPDLEAIGAIVEEFFRQQVIFPAAAVARSDWLLGVVGVVNTQQLLYQLFVAANQPLPPMGVKQWSSRLTRHQRDVLEALPVPNPRRAETVAAMLAARAAMLTFGRETAETAGFRWPEDLDEAVSQYYAKELGAPPADSSVRAVSSLSTSETTRIANPGE